jgi:hypothetical protein
MAAAPARCLRSGQPRRSPGSSAASCCAAEHRRRQAGIIAQSTRRSYTPVVAVSGISRSQLLVPLLLSAVGLLWSLAGCRTGAELVEAELRRKERENEQLSQKLRDCECEVRLLEAEYERLLHELRTTGKAELRGLAYLKGITLGRLTGGLDDDPDCPGDDALVVVLEPRDLDDQVVKVPGHVHVDVYEITPQGLKQPLSSWDIPARELRGKWETPLLGSPAYRLTLRWKVIPHYERLRVVVRFTTLDGQMFETDRDVTIRPPRREPDRCRTHAPQTTPTSQGRMFPAWIGIPQRSVRPPNLVPTTPSQPQPEPAPVRQENNGLPPSQDSPSPQNLPPPPPGPILLPVN